LLLLAPPVAAWTPANDPGTLLWLRADDIAGSDGDEIGAWVSREGNAYSFEATLTTRPLLKLGANGIGGHPALLFDGINDILLCTTNMLSGASGTVMAVFNLTTPLADWTNILGSCDEATNNYVMAIMAPRVAATARLSTYQKNNDIVDGVIGSTALSAAANYIGMWQSSGTAYALKLNGTDQVITADLGVDNGDWWGDTTNRDSVTVGGQKAVAAGNFFKGLLAEIIVTTSVNTVTQLEAYLANRYGPFSLLAFGDSITVGTGATDAAHRWANIVAASKNAILTNAGIAATILQNTVQTTVDTIGAAADNNGRDTYAARITAYTGAPWWVFILYGLNDLRLNDAAITVENYTTDLGAVIDGILADGVLANHIVIGSPPYIPEASYAAGAPWNAGTRVKHAAYTAACAAVATAKGTRYADVYQYMTDNGGDTLIAADGIHPNDAGHAAIAAAFLAVI